MNTIELKHLLEIASDPTENENSIAQIAEVLRSEIRKKDEKYRGGNIDSRDGKTLMSIFDAMYYETIEEKPQYLLQLLPIFHFLCCEDKLEWELYLKQ